MRKTISLIQVYLFSLVLIILLIFPLLGFFWIKQEIDEFRYKSTDLRQEYIESSKATIKNEVDNAVDFINFTRAKAEENLKRKVKSKTLYGIELLSGIYNANKARMSLLEMKDLAHDVLSEISWDEGLGYYFVENMQGYEIINPNNPELEGTDIIDIQDSNGTYIVKEILKTAKNQEGEGFVTYFWNRPDNPDKLVPKISYVKYFEPFEWVLGTGKYLEEEEEFIKEETLTSLEKFYFTESGVFFGGNWKGQNLFDLLPGTDNYKYLSIFDSELVEKFITIAREGSGFIELYSDGFVAEEPLNLKSISYISGIEEWEMYIGSSIDLDGIEKSIKLEQDNLNIRIKDRIFRIIFYVLIFIFVGTIIAFLISRRIKNNINLFKDFFIRAAHDLTVIDTHKLFFRESVILANSANFMVKERHKVLKKLLDSEKRVFQIIEAANIPMAIGKDGDAEFLNKSFRETFGYTLKEIPTLEKMWELSYPDPVYRDKVQKDWQKAIEKFSEGKAFQKQYCTVRCKNGEDKEVEIDFSPLGDGGLTTFRDLTEHNKREAEKILLEKKLLRAQKMEAIGLMAGGVAHDLNNILSGIVGYPDLIKMSLDEDSEIIPHVEAIKRSGLRAVKMRT